MSRSRRTSMHFGILDLAEACNLSAKTISRKGINLKTVGNLSIEDLVSFVLENKRVPSDNLLYDKSTDTEGFRNKKRCRLHFHKKEVADFIGISFRKLQYLCIKKKIKLENLTFNELIDFINSNKQK